MDHRQAYKWQKKQDKKEEFYDTWRSSSNNLPRSFKKSGYNRYQITIRFAYRPVDENKNPTVWYYRFNDDLHKDDEVLWTEQIFFYLDKNGKIDWILTNKEQFYTKFIGKFEPEIIDSRYKGKDIKCFKDYILVDETVYKLFQRQQKLKRILE